MTCKLLLAPCLEGPVFVLVLCPHHLEIFDNFELRVPQFHSLLGHANHAASLNKPLFYITNNRLFLYVHFPRIADFLYQIFKGSMTQKRLSRNQLYQNQRFSLRVRGPEILKLFSML